MPPPLTQLRPSRPARGASPARASPYGSPRPKARARRSARSRRTRSGSFLTTLGIVIGVASVIAMVSIIQGLSFTIGQQFEGLGSNSVTVASYTRARGPAARTPRAAHGAGPRSHPVSRGRNRVDHADHVHTERPRPDPLRLADDDVAGARHDVLVSRRRAVFLAARPILVRQRQCDAPPRRGDRREGARRSFDAREPGRRVRADQWRVAQDHRPARAEGRDPRPEPGQSRADPVQHDGEPAGQSAQTRHPDSAHARRSAATSRTSGRRSRACCATRTISDPTTRTISGFRPPSRSRRRSTRS